MQIVIDFLNTILWNYVLIAALLCVGVWFTVNLRFIQFRHFPEFFRLVVSASEGDRRGITPFQALCTSLASRVGTGNIAGVAVALTMGGPGSIFWMWVVALLGMATAYAESTLAQLFKVRNDDGEFRGGPAFYIDRGLRAPWAAVVFSLCLILTFGLVFNAVQANSIAEAMEASMSVPKWSVGLGLVLMAGSVIFGGVRKIARVAELLVPVMAIGYVLLALYVMAVNAQQVPIVLATIFKSAFGLEPAVGGVAGALLNGIKRGLYSNEAGMGSAPNIAAVAVPDPHHPSSQGFVQALGVFIDTIVICTATAVLILMSGVLGQLPGVTGTALTQHAFSMHVGDAGVHFIAVAVLLFAFTSIIGNYAYAENALTYLKANGVFWRTVLRLGALAMVFWGSIESVMAVFNMADAAMGLMASVNLVAIVLLSPIVFKLTRDYFAQKQAGVPCFNPDDYPELRDKIEVSVWQKSS
ncbi:alanine/glycine:cation symporter family protein [Orrella sp. 11846]|uniref:alanine/glycine:cation symporter family protein n=1 Tax=Orrella sp. 11846 TaxID=3409913 RepID=UPI003B5B6877